MERSHVEQLEGVRELCEHVSISQAGIDAVVESMTTEQLQQLRSPQSWDKEVHFMDGTALTVQYLLVVDALNFCFWQDEELEYEHLARGVKRAVEADTSVLDAQRLADITGDGVRKLLGWTRDLPLQKERARLLRELGAALRDGFDGSAAKLVEAAGKSAVRLVQLVTQHLPGFRDHAVYKGRQVFFYKRAQIFVGDLWGAFAGSSWGEFHDIDSVTMFADYRVPVVLREMGVLEYGKALAGKVDGRDEMSPGSDEELEVRIATILAVEDLKAALQRRCGREPAPNSVQLDWWLWTEGERDRFKHRPHHRTLTIYY